MEGILKSAPLQTVAVKQEQQRAEGITPPDIIPQEYFDFFNLKRSDRGYEQLDTVVGWAKGESKSLGDALLKISNVELKLGVPAFGETRLSRIYNYVRMHSRLENKQHESKANVDGIRNKHKAFLAEAEKTYKDKVTKINDELARVTREYEIERNRYERTASQKSSDARKEYSDQIRELKKLRTAYMHKGGK